MAQYVYALHDFTPEHEDEISFHAGERIEVLERDDMYSDGWWQGRNLAGQSGLFPAAYTTPLAPSENSARSPTTGSSLHPLQEEAPEVNGSRDGTVMAATMTDIQEAIEQLGIKGENDHDAARSFSFASKDDTDHDFDSDKDTEDGDQDDERRKDARKMLAEKAKREIERREKAEVASTPRTAAPPIEAEISDESDGEDEDDRTGHRHRHKFPSVDDRPLPSGTPKATEFPTPTPTTGHLTPANTGSLLAQESHAEPDSPLVHQAEEPAPEQPQRRSPSPRPLEPPAHIEPRVALKPTPSSDTIPSPRGITPPQAFDISPSSSQPAPASPVPLFFEMPRPQAEPRFPTPRHSGLTGPVASRPPSLPGSQQHSRIQSYSSGQVPQPWQERQFHNRTSTEMAAALPSPAASSIGANGATMSAMSSAVPRSTLSTAPSVVTSGSSAPTQSRTPFVSKTHPSEWTVEQVIEWLRHKGFDEGICAKFAEHEITGDVLLDLDANLLKELDIVAFGKRMRIANAIHELHRPPSIVSSEHSGQNGHAPAMPVPTYAYGRQSQGSSMHQSMPSPSPLAAHMMSPESPPNTGDIVETPASMRSRPESDPGTDLSHKIGGVGLGFSTHERGRPPALNLSPSDSALKARPALADQMLENLQEEPRQEDERAVLSEGETAQGLEQRVAKRRMGRASDPPSAVSETKDTPPPSATPSSATMLRGVSEGGHKTRRSVDVTKPVGEPNSRLSFFSSTLGKSRKPPPRVSSGDHTPEVTQAQGQNLEKNRSLSRLYMGGSTTKRPSSRAGDRPVSRAGDAIVTTSPRTGTEQTAAKESKPDAALRKRTLSVPERSRGGQMKLKPGMGIVEQIGDADFSGWMRKRGERYNTWKMRYFVLKGPDLYYLRSRDETKLKGYINILGYKVIADENANPGRYGFRIIHDTDKTHFFSSEEQSTVREWMKAIMKATIDRDYTRPVISSCNIPTIPLTVAQAMSPPPRPPSPTARDATQKALRRENPNQLSSRDARILMGLPSTDGSAPVVDPLSRKRLESFFTADSTSTGGGRDAFTTPVSPTAPIRPSRDARKPVQSQSESPAVDADLIKWINSHLPPHLQVNDLSTSLATGLVLFRVAEAIKGRPSEVPDSAFPSGPGDDNLDGLFKLFDFMLDEDIKTGSVSINDVRQGKREKIIQLVQALKGWEDRRLTIAKSIGQGAMLAGPWMGPVVDPRW